MNLDELKKRIRRFNLDRDWDQFHSPENLAKSISIEAGELLECFQWGEEYNIEENPIEELTKIYVRINNLCKEDESVLELCRENFKKLEDGDSYCVELWDR